MNNEWILTALLQGMIQQQIYKSNPTREALRKIARNESYFESLDKLYSMADVAYVYLAWNVPAWFKIACICSSYSGPLIQYDYNATQNSRTNYKSTHTW
jgi:hypothetical protein